LIAEDISDFQIEGMSIGDSALDYFSEEEIKNNLKNYYNDKTYLVTEIEFISSFKVYDAIQLHFKSFDKNYTIESITGFLDYENNINECYDQKNEIYNDIASLFKNMKNDKYDFPHNADKSKKSIVSVSEFFDDDFVIRVSCTDWTKQMGYMDTLQVSIDKTDFLDWVENSAYK
jgi:hypothetical protein